MLSLPLIWIEEYDIMWNDPIAPLLNSLKTKNKLYFIILIYTLDNTLYRKLYIYIQINSKLNIKVQSVIIVIV